MKIEKKKYKWLKSWNLPWHTDDRKERFNLLDNYLKTPPKSILDIGCGLARESEYFQKKYNTDLYLLDGDFDQTKEKPRDNQWGSAESFRFYSPMQELLNSYDSRNMSYTFIDASNPIIQIDKKFDVIYSLLSCGFHYPAITYKDLIEKHSTNDTKIIIDCRFDTLQDQKQDFEVIKIIKEYDHYYKLEIKFK